ncbi:MAG: MaoC/PaaZ C-terminal domain-containing protein [Hyphomonadaceae bacterium]|nr:MaoC/PaaZ C-terminal domain-containing protein [Hyphomonadaceae bacterium]
MSELDLSAAEVGATLPDVEFGPISRATLALYAGASGDHNPVHIDLDFAKAAGLPDVFAHGMLSFGVLTRVVTSWAGIGRLREFAARFVSITQVHDRITCKATIIEKFEAEGEQRLRLNLIATAQDGRETLNGHAVVAVS